MEKTEQLGEYIYRWDEGCFPFGRDSLELGEFCTLKPGQSVADLGCGPEAERTVQISENVSASKWRFQGVSGMNCAAASMQRQMRSSAHPETR